MVTFLASARASWITGVLPGRRRRPAQGEFLTWWCIPAPSSTPPTPPTAVATITLNRPDRLNALTFEVYTELRDTFRALDTEPGVRSIVITGSGRAFCAGGDVEDIVGALFSRDAEGCSSSPGSPAT